MGLEIVMFVMLIVGSIFGLIFPVVFWALRSALAVDRFTQALGKEQVCVLSSGNTDAHTKATLEIEHDHKRATLIAYERGQTPLWHIYIKGKARIEFGYCDKRWAAMPDFRERCSERAPLGCEEISSEPNLLFAASTDEHAFFEIRRGPGLEANDAKEALELALRFTRQVGLRAPITEDANSDNPKRKSSGQPIALPGLSALSPRFPPQPA